MLQCCPEVDDLSHVLKIHVGELLPIISIEELILLLIHIIQFPQIVHDLLVSHSNGDELVLGWS